MRLIQLQNNNDQARRVAVVDEPVLRLIDGYRSIYALARGALDSNRTLLQHAQGHIGGESLAYGPIYEGRSVWRILPPIDHQDDPARCLVSGTGLTHLGSAQNRQAMHETPESQLTDSMKMFKLGLEGGRPAPGQIGVPPEWFLKGSGAVLRAHREPLVVPDFGEDGGEEAEVAGVYLIDEHGQPRRIGLAAGNEFSDHRFERRNYLNLAGSKLRTCSIGPELVIDHEFGTVTGKATITRGAATVWEKEVFTGDAEMCHSVANIEHHHFKFDAHRRPGDVHVHYFGAYSLSIGEGIQLENGDVMTIAWDGFGRPLVNPLQVVATPETLIAAPQI